MKRVPLEMGVEMRLRFCPCRPGTCRHKELRAFKVALRTSEAKPQVELGQGCRL